MNCFVHQLSRLTVVLALALGSIAPVSAAQPSRTLTIGQSVEPSSIDPLFARTGNNQQTAENMFDRLASFDANMQFQPGLALSWKAVTPLVWEIKLRAGVKFHDGSPFSATDVAFSLDRAGKVPNSPAPFSGAVSSIAKVEIVDPLTLRITTKKQAPALMEQIGIVYMVSKRATEGKTSNDYNSGAAAIGTGMFKFKQWLPGDRLVLERNDQYWGKPSDFSSITIRFISNDAARLSALLSGSVDLIDSIPPTDIPRLKSNNKIKVFSIPSARLIYLALDSSRDTSPFVTDLNGARLTPNPLKDVRVRLAISKLIDREAITKRLLGGAGEPAAQIVPNGLGGASSRLRPVSHDPVGAKTLLQQAGYPNGFGLTVHSSNDRFASDSDLGQAIGQMLARGGIKINGVVTQPYNVYAGAASKQEYSAFVFSFGNTTSDSAIALTSVMATYDKESGQGAFNRARYSNAALDGLLARAVSTYDRKEREQLLREAAEAGFNDVGIVPLYFPVVYWAGKPNVVFRANMMERTSALYVEAAK